MKDKKREKVWEERYTFGNREQDTALDAMARDLGVSEHLAILLWNRGYRTAEEAKRFLWLEQENFHDPYRLADMSAAVERILQAVEKREKITVYGDYDVDGVTSVTVLYLYLKELGADVGFRIPKREGEGYGVSCTAVEELARDGTDLIITVDTGVTANAEVAYAKTLGVDVVITDHHECRAELPPACAVVNPHRPDCPYPFKELAGVGVVFKTVCACEIRRCREAGIPAIDGVRRICTEYADLIAVGTIADVMPVTGENRLIVSLGLKRLSQTKRPGLKALIEAAYPRKGANEKTQKITSGMIGFGIAPRINAAGRINDAAIAVQLLLEQDAERAKEAAEELCEINRRRQAEENRIATEAYEQIEREQMAQRDSVIVLGSDSWHPGIIGIVSSRVTERYGLPSVLVSFEGNAGEASPDDDGKGSGRSIPGMNLVEALTECGDLLVKYGGHALAAGLTVKRKDLEAFRQAINRYAAAHLAEDAWQIRVEADCCLRMRDATLAFAKELSLLEPFGVGNATPLFMMKNVTVKRVNELRGGKHTRLMLEQEGASVTALYFGVSEKEIGVKEGDVIDILFHMDVNEYKNVLSVQLTLQDLRKTDALSRPWERERERYREIDGGETFSVREDILPERDDFAAIYQILRREARAGIRELDLHTLMRYWHTERPEHAVNSVKLKYILRILHELDLCEVEGSDGEIYRFSVRSHAAKTSIERSAILKKLREQCYDRSPLPPVKAGI